MQSAFKVQSTFLERPLSPTAKHFPHIVLEFLRATTYTSTNLKNQGILVHFLAKEQEITLFQRVQPSKGPIQALGQ